jgi:hypothetical protein
MYTILNRAATVGIQTVHIDSPWNSNSVFVILLDKYCFSFFCVGRNKVQDTKSLVCVYCWGHFEQFKRRWERSKTTISPCIEVTPKTSISAASKHTICNYSHCRTVILIFGVSSICLFYCIYVTHCITVPVYCVNSPRSPEQINFCLEYKPCLFFCYRPIYCFIVTCLLANKYKLKWYTASLHHLF